MAPGPLGRGCGGTLMFLGLAVVAMGCWVFVVSWRKYQLCRRTRALAARARELAPELEPGEIVCIEGRVVDGSLVEPTAIGDVAQYSDHLLVEDARGRAVRLGLPGRNEVPDRHRAGDLVFAVGRLAPRGDGVAYRSSREIDTLTGDGAGSLWVAAGGREAALRTLQGTFLDACGEGPAILLGGLAIALSGALLGC